MKNVKLILIIISLLLANALFASQKNGHSKVKVERIIITIHDKIQVTNVRMGFSNNVKLIWKNIEYKIYELKYLFKASTPRAMKFYSIALKEYYTTIFFGMMLEKT